MSGLFYSTTQSRTLIGSKTGTTRTSIELESTYKAESVTEATKSFKIAGFSKLNLDILYTMGAAETTNSIEIKTEQSPDGTNWYQLVNDSTTTGVSTLTSREFTIVGVNADEKAFSLPIDISDQYFRISIKETGAASNKGSVYVEATLLGL